MKNLKVNYSLILVSLLILTFFICINCTSYAATLSKDVLMKGDRIKYTGSSTWTAYKTATAAKYKLKVSRSKVYSSGAEFEIKSISKNVIKVAKSQYLNYTDYASNNCTVLSHTDANNRTFTLYRQNSDTYKNVSYPGRYKGLKTLPKNYNTNPKLGPNGCGPTSCAIVASGFGIKKSTPDKIIADGKNYSTPEGIKAYFEKNGCQVTIFDSLSNKNVIKKLQAGYKIIVLADYDAKVGNYTCNGYQHWYTLLDTDGTRVYVGDPLQGRGGLYNPSNLTNRLTHICIKK